MRAILDEGRVNGMGDDRQSSLISNSIALERMIYDDDNKVEDFNVEAKKFGVAWMCGCHGEDFRCKILTDIAHNSATTWKTRKKSR